MPDTPALSKITFDSNGSAHVFVVSRQPNLYPDHTVIWSVDGSLPIAGAPETKQATLKDNQIEIVVGRTSALNVRFIIESLPLPSLTLTAVISVDP